MAGVRLVVNRRQLETLINQGNGPELQSVFTPGGSVVAGTDVAQTARTAQLQRQPDTGVPNVSDDSAPPEDAHTDLSTFFPEPVKTRSATWWKPVLLYAGLALMALVTAIALDPLRDFLLGLVQHHQHLGTAGPRF